MLRALLLCVVACLRHTRTLALRGGQKTNEFRKQQ
jgi:hypothetical protein